MKIGAAISAGGVLLFAGACILEALRKKKKAAVSASGEAVEIPPEDADLIFEETEAPEKPDPDVEAPDDSDETETLPDVDEITSEQEDNEEETT